MAAKLNYLLSEEWNSKVKGLNLSIADESDLRYNAFLGDIMFQIDDVDFNLNWGWIPILDFAACLVSISQKLLRGSEYEVFDFTESDAEIIFKCGERIVAVSASYADIEATIEIDDLAELAHAFWDKAIKDFTLAYPEISKNPTFRNMLETTGQP